MSTTSSDHIDTTLVTILVERTQNWQIWAHVWHRKFYQDKLMSWIR